MTFVIFIVHNGLADVSDGVISTIASRQEHSGFEAADQLGPFYKEFAWVSSQRQAD